MGKFTFTQTEIPADFVEGCLIAAWPQVFQMVLDNRDIPV